MMNWKIYHDNEDHDHACSCALWIIPGSTIVEVSAPFVVVEVLDVVTICVLGKDGDVVDGGEAVVGIHNLKVPEVARFSKAIFREVTGTHLCGGVLAVCPGVHHLTTPLHHRRTVL